MKGMMNARKRKIAGTSEEGEKAGKRPHVSVYSFEVLMPHGVTVSVKIHYSGDRISLSDFANRVKKAYDELPGAVSKRGCVDWLSTNLHFVDAFENLIRPDLNFAKFPPNVCHIVRLKDGSAESDSFENMWDLTPHTDLLQELPEEYTFDTGLADLIDNSLQAVWANEAGRRKLIKVKIAEKGIEIFDSGPGMDASPENSIVKWGKLGASMHRSARERGIGIKPPYLTPSFGMFGFGGPIATMYLGRRAVVASKTEKSKKVFLLHLEKEAILKSNSKQPWRANGGVREPKTTETEESPHGSFTKVQIHGVKLQGSIEQVRSRLKDIYFPYIQCDELSAAGKTISPIEFQVNGVNLAEVLGGEVAITNMHSCNGPEFTLQLQFTNFETSSSSTGKRSDKANARLRCVYFPIIKGKESFESILEKLKEDKCGTGENFKSFSRVSVRRLGRLLPEARWAWLPFMEPKQKRNVKGQILRRLCHRVKCFIDTDAGFNPTTSKTDLAPQNPFTVALKYFGKKKTDTEIGVNVTITKDGMKLSHSELDRQYEEWLKLMHDQYDQEMVSGFDEAVFVLNPPNKEDLGISSNVIRVHKRFWRNETLWESGKNVKILKGASAGFHNTDTYATLEYIILEGFEGDAGCEVRLICRPIEVPADSGCFLTEDQSSSSIRLGSSFSIPVSVIDSNKFIAVDDELWHKQLQRRSLKAPSCIEILGSADCHELGMKGEIPQCVDAGYIPPENIVAIIRPWSFKSDPSSKNLDKKQIVQEQIPMMMEIKFEADHTTSMEYEYVFSDQMNPTMRRGINGFYIFNLQKECPKIFEKPGLYTFLFSLKNYENVKCERTVKVNDLLNRASLRLLDEGRSEHSDLAVPLVEVHVPEPDQQDSEDMDLSDDSDYDLPSAKINLKKGTHSGSEPPFSPKGKRLVSEEAAAFDQSVKDHQIIVHPGTPIPCNVIYESDSDDQPENPINTVEADEMVLDTVEESLDHLTLPELEIEIKKTGEQVNEVENKIKSLVIEQAMLKESIGKLQAESEHLSESNPFSLASEQDLVKKQISVKTDSAAAAICQSSQPFLSEENQWENILGVVACVGSVQDDVVSRILAYYLGEQNMLGVVCKREEESLFESDRNICALAAAHGMPIPKNYHLYCIEKIRPFSGSVSNDSQRKLQLPDPRLPSGECPPGFLGYAVNMIELDLKLRPWRTASGHGLRETLLYRLFNKLQVYQSMDHMMHARSCIMGEAVSLDGATLRGNGLVSFLHGEVDIQFPVCPEPAPEDSEIEAEMEALWKLQDRLRKERTAHEGILKRFKMQGSRFELLCAAEESKISQKFPALMPPSRAYIEIKDELEEVLALMPPPLPGTYS